MHIVFLSQIMIWNLPTPEPRSINLLLEVISVKWSIIWFITQTKFPHKPATSHLLKLFCLRVHSSTIDFRVTTWKVCPKLEKCVQKNLKNVSKKTWKMCKKNWKMCQKNLKYVSRKNESKKIEKCVQKPCKSVSKILNILEKSLVISLKKALE